MLMGGIHSPRRADPHRQRHQRRNNKAVGRLGLRDALKSPPTPSFRTSAELLSLSTILAGNKHFNSLQIGMSQSYRFHSSRLSMQEAWLHVWSRHISLIE